MSQIEYRPLCKKDDAAVKHLINEAFGLHAYINHPGVLDSALSVYLQSCLAEATFTCAAQKDGVLIGVIMGKASRRHPVFAHLKAACRMGYHTLAMHCKAFIFGVRNNDFKKIHQTYHALSAACPQRFDGVLTLFAITESCRGMGVGKELLRRLHAYQKAHGVTNSYLYTDSSCNVGFYEHAGFRQLAECDMEITRNGAQVPFTVYLYGETL